MYLIDTNILLFSLDCTEKLSSKVKHILQTEETIFISMASFCQVDNVPGNFRKFNLIDC